MKFLSHRRAAVPAIAALALSFTLAACGDDSDSDTGSDVDDSVSGSVAVDGSSTVFPMSDAAGELLMEENPDIEVGVGFSGTGGGFEKFCVGETDISDASRPIDEEEIAVCEENGIEYTELLIATDALTVVVNPDLDVDCLTTDELITLLGPNDKPTNWSEINPDFPDVPIAGFIPGTDSGTYDYMANDVVGDDSEALRDDFETSEDDNIIVQGVSGTEGGVGFFGFTYFEENPDAVKALSIDDGNGCVAPSAETAQAGEYTPLARPLFIYVNNAKYAENPAVKAYVDFYIENLPEIAEAARFIPLNEDDYAATQEAVESLG